MSRMNGDDGDGDTDGNASNDQNDVDKGRMALPKRMNFRRSSRGGRGSFPIQKFILQILDL